MYAITSPIPQFFDLSGDPLDAGKIYIGTAGANPITTPVAVFWDEAATQPAQQPLRTVSGYIARNGKPARVFGAGDGYAITVHMKSDVHVMTELNATSLGVLPVAAGGTGATNAADARTALGAAGLGANTFTGAQTLPGNAANPLEAVPLQQLPGKNRVINGAMRIDQEFAGALTTVTAGAALLYVLDQWYAYCTGANVSAQQIAIASGQNRLRITGAASNTGVGVGQRIEAIESLDLAGGQATIQAKLSSSSLVTVGWALYYANTKDTFGTLASPTRALISSGSWAISNTESTKTATVSIPSGAITGLELVITAGPLLSGQTLTLGDVQIEAGPVATTFERIPYTSDMDRACRYYWTPGRSIIVGAIAASTGQPTYTNCPTPVEMRATPTIAFVPAANVNVSLGDAINKSKWGATFYAQSGSAGTFSVEFTSVKFSARL